MGIKSYLATALSIAMLMGCQVEDDTAQNAELAAAPNSAAQLLELVRSTGKSRNILSGQESMVWGDHDEFGYLYPTEYDEYAFNATNKMPAIFASDFGDFHHGDQSLRYKTRDLALRYAQEGSIVSLSYHICAPDYSDGCGAGTGEGVKVDNYPSSNIDQILTPGTGLNRIHMQRLDEIANYLLDLKRANVPVLWRPFHEMNGDWFWWGQQPRYVELYRQMHDYFDSKGLDNLVWVWSVNYWWPNNSEEFPQQYYPGDRYVDVIGADIYQDNKHRHSFDKRIYDGLKAVSSSKPLGITENGLIPDWTEMVKTQPDWAFYITWWGYERDSSTARYQKNYNSGMVITQDGIGSNVKPVPPVAGANNGTDSDCVDEDGDGWGWNHTTNKSCEVGRDSGNSISDCVDSDGDGWGWSDTLQDSCRV